MKNTKTVWYIIGAILPIALGVFIVWYNSQSIGNTNSYVLVNSNSSCIECHGAMDGLSPLHNQLDCISCHKGNNLSFDKDSAHYGMLRIPGNLADASETCGVCHPDAIEHISSSLMTSNSGIIAVDKFIFGEEASPNTIRHVENTGNSMADEHLRALCLRCHLGSDKKIYGPITQESRGGGCNACHLNYSSQAKNELLTYLENGSLPKIHPSLDLNITNEHCFGCHSRSGRLSTNYEGYHETLLLKNDILEMTGYRELDDGRIFKEVSADIHHERGLACIDCHGYGDVMGDGKTYIHEEEAVKISCEDCHTINLKSQLVNESNMSQQRIVKMRNYEHADRPMLLTSKDSTLINNAYLDNDGSPKLVSKISGEKFDLLAPSSSCTREFGHNSLTCTSCHTQWAPQCIGCHTTYEADSKGYDLLDKKEMEGIWVEYAGSFLYGPPTLGVRENTGRNTIEPAIPGMIMTLDKGSFATYAMPQDTSFYRLFAPASPHTIGAEGRDCKSCHNNPLALGYGRGSLQLTQDDNRWQWSFTSEYENLDDGLPADAWTGFMKERNGIVSTRTNFRPFSIEEQKRILRVGACLTCHDDSSPEMRNSLNSDFDNYLNHISDLCIVVYK
jgi:hypothetical protein